MRKGFYRFLVALVISITVFMYFSNKSDDFVLDKEGKAFAIEDFEAIDRILIKHKDQILTLVEFGQSWKVEGQAIITEAKEKLLPLVFEGLKVRFAAPNEKSDSIKQSILNDGYQVQLEGKGELLHSFCIAPKRIDSLSIYGFLNATSEVYALYVLGEKIDFESFFSVKPGAWRSLLLWDFSRERWGLIRFEASKDSALNYSLSLDHSSMKLKQFGKEQPLEYGKAVDWINEISSRKAKDFIGYEVPDDTASVLCSFSLSNGEKSQEFKAIERKAPAGAIDLLGNSLLVDREYFYLMRGEEVFLVDYFSFEPILQGIKTFQ